MIALYHLSIQCLPVFQQIIVTDIFPAKILAQHKTISEDSDLYVTCSTFGNKKYAMGYVYLCKDDFGINMKAQKRDQNDTTFTISRVGLYDSGNYSCVYSKRNVSLSNVATRGDNIIQILVIGKGFYSCESIMSMLFPSTHFVLPQPIFSLQIFQ